MSAQNSVIAIYHTHLQAEEALKELQKAGFDMTKLSIVGHHHTEEHVVGYYNTADRMKRWGTSGGFRGLAPSLSRDPWSPGSWERWEAPSSSADSALREPASSIGVPTDSAAHELDTAREIMRAAEPAELAMHRAHEVGAGDGGSLKPGGFPLTEDISRGIGICGKGSRNKMLENSDVIKTDLWETDEGPMPVAVRDRNPGGSTRSLRVRAARDAKPGTPFRPGFSWQSLIQRLRSCSGAAGSTSTK